MKPLIRIKTRKWVEFKYSAAPGSQVSVAGTFNGWNTTVNPLKDNPDSGHFKAKILLTEGLHQYKYFVNGSWVEDPESLSETPDGYGDQNSIIIV